MNFAITYVLTAFTIWSGHAVAECAPLFVTERERIEASLNLIFARGPKSRADETLSRLDRDVTDWILRKSAPLSPEQRENVLLILEDSRHGFNFRTGTRIYLERVDGEINWDFGSPRLVTDGALKRTEGARAILVHEMEHVFRGVVEGDLTLSAERLEANANRRLGVYRDEIYAFRAEYRHLRRNYTAADLPRLAEMAAVYVDLWVDGLRSGLIRGEDVRDDLRVLKTHRSPAQNLALARLMISRGNYFFREQVEAALGQSEFDFVKSYVATYRTDQARKVMEKRWCGRRWIELADKLTNLRDRLERVRGR